MHPTTRLLPNLCSDGEHHLEYLMRYDDTNRHCKFLMVITSNVSAVSDSKVIVDDSEPGLEPDGTYS